MAGANVTLIEILKEQLSAGADPERAAGQGQYMKRALPFLGLRVPEVRRITALVERQHPLGSFGEWQATVQALFFDAQHQEERYAAAALCGLRRYRAYQRAAALAQYERMITAAAWWDLVDDLSDRVGEVLLADHEKVATKLRRWAKCEDIWLRRTAIICQRKHEQQTDWKLLQDCMAPSIDSGEFFLQKAIGWALRSVAEHDPEATRRYVRDHDKRLSALSKREALKHLGQPRASRKPKK